MSVSFTSVSKYYDNFQALNNINTIINKGEKVAILGSNGAGKTTLLNLIIGHIKPSNGEILVFDNKKAQPDKVAYLPQTLSFPQNIKVKEIINLVGSHFNNRKIDYDFGVNNYSNKYVDDLSGGEARKLALLITFIGNRPLSILDEPTANIDVEGRKEIHTYLKEYFSDNKKTLIFSSHLMSEVESLAERIIILKNGKIVTDGKSEEIKEKFGLKKISFKNKEKFEKIPCDKIIQKDDSISIYGKDSDYLIKEVLKKNPHISNISITTPPLDEILLKIWNLND